MNKRKANWEAIEQFCKPGNDEMNDPYSFYDLPKSLQVNLVTWCLRYHRQDKINHDHTSYGLKHIFSDFTRVYVTNGQFKGAMLVAGFRVHDMSERNWKFNVNKREINMDKELLKKEKPMLDEIRKNLYELSKPENKEIRAHIENEIEKRHKIYMQGFNDCKKQYGISEVEYG